MAPGDRSTRKLKKGVYTAPEKNFSVEVGRGVSAKDGFAKDVREAFVEFTDRDGNFNAIWCTPYEPSSKMQEALAAEAKATEFFTSYFGDVIMPWIFYPISADSAVLSSSVVSYDSAPAYYFLVNVPGASGLMDMMTNEYYDGRRATFLFNKCGYTYIVVHELVAGFAGVTRTFDGDEMSESMIQEDMADGEEALSEFIDKITFSGCAGAPGEASP